MTDLLRWLRALQWIDEPNTVTFLELALDFEEFSEHTLPQAPQVRFKGHTHTPPGESTSALPLGGPMQAGLNRRPCFTRRHAMIKHIAWLSQYYEATWTQRMHARAPVPRPYTYRARRTPAEVEEARVQRALTGSLNTGIMPSSSHCAKGGGGGKSFACDLFPIIGDGRVPQAPYTGTHRHTATPSQAPSAGPAPPARTLCTVHSMPACATCKRLRLPAADYCAKGHHRAGYVDRQPLSKVCAAHGLPPCPGCMLMHRGVRHCCSRGHHKVCTPVPTQKRPAPPPVGHCKRPCLQSTGPRDAHSFYALHQ